MTETQISERGLKLLSIDGGGIRGLSPLFILHNLMWRIKMAKNLEDLPLPCEYFDLIGGTSTGGLTALMLGRLRMPVGEAIERWGVFSEKVFGANKGSSTAYNDGRRAATFESMLKSLVQDKTAKRNAKTLMIDQEGESMVCRTFVCAMNAHNMNATTPVLFRTYKHPKEVPKNCMIWQAARATCALPLLFKPIEIGSGSIKQPYIDGAMGRNNPAQIVLEEAKTVFHGREIACLISIGTGHPQTMAIPPRSRFLEYGVMQTMQRIATDCLYTAQLLEQQYRDTPNVYFRLNVEQGMQDISSGQWERLSEVQAHTEQYLKDERVDQTVERIIQILRHGRLKTKTPVHGIVPVARVSATVALRDKETIIKRSSRTPTPVPSSRPSTPLAIMNRPKDPIFDYINKDFQRWTKCIDYDTAVITALACAVDYHVAVEKLTEKINAEKSVLEKKELQAYEQRRRRLEHDYDLLTERFEHRWLDMSDHEISLEFLPQDASMPNQERSLEISWDPPVDAPLEIILVVIINGNRIPNLTLPSDHSNRAIVQVPKFDLHASLIVTVEVAVCSQTLHSGQVTFQSQGNVAKAEYRESPPSTTNLDAYTDFSFTEHPPDTKPGGMGRNSAVLLLGAFRYWPFSYVDNRMATVLIAQDQNGTVAKLWHDLKPARYVDRIDIDGDKVTFTGQSNYTVKLRLQDLLIPLSPPIYRTRITTRDARIQPPLLDDLCYSSTSLERYPVLVIGTYTFWPVTSVPSHEKVTILIFNSQKEHIRECIWATERNISVISRLDIEKASLKVYDTEDLSASIPLQDLKSYLSDPRLR
ncbi:acyl transferase/acyl hydrolase/lysophospholipase [Desarmillaria tabescens]|uniref:Acyl transferase/acyl hydrolase/lysophospholipase n=1 Tax=Armillaria tabescens TaxID=1929756 RepID=A0AA39JRC2_ARMTA|nr:acyl transferase/acyl hydrolase/lysophospholipase [Desarmillaria tabescens]KAK0446049.1 acyl transferase/acyl hydrolase/lysophospholipase [Desarmillaria tabescens]